MHFTPCCACVLPLSRAVDDLLLGERAAGHVLWAARRVAQFVRLLLLLLELVVVRPFHRSDGAKPPARPAYGGGWGGEQGSKARWVSGLGVAPGIKHSDTQLEESILRSRGLRVRSHTARHPELTLALVFDADDDTTVYPILGRGRRSGRWPDRPEKSVR